MGMYLQGVIEEFVIFKAFHQAARVVEMTVFLKQLCFFRLVFNKGMSAKDRFLKCVCSR